MAAHFYISHSGTCSQPRHDACSCMSVSQAVLGSRFIPACTFEDPFCSTAWLLRARSSSSVVCSFGAFEAACLKPDPLAWGLGGLTSGFKTLLGSWASAGTLLSARPGYRLDTECFHERIAFPDNLIWVEDKLRQIMVQWLAPTDRPPACRPDQGEGRRV